MPGTIMKVEEMITAGRETMHKYIYDLLLKDVLDALQACRGTDAGRGGPGRLNY